ncbi:GNAT family N-acetyltransferase [Mammaliicoccus lentus]|uniref:GNAT family N-acetyltransferase n=2 Tax=Mammaliicoccus lentus TaxID=42858 RepID=A0ABS6GZW0_MAMLE|nr:GNAT family N-acetyltransferase [Mammaliicoccus lentus]MBU6115007.1 GNAT family N-acetyltransferase [Mammaliicoccus lentus]
MIYKLREKDEETLNSLGKIWLNTNITVHNFIEEEYWQNNYENVVDAFKEAEIIVYTKNGEIIGFCGLIDNYIAGMFIVMSNRNQGIGTKIIKYLQKEKEYLSLKVYKENKKAVNFYKKNHFKIEELSEDETGNDEYTMYWKNKNKFAKQR